MKLNDIKASDLTILKALDDPKAVSEQTSWHPDRDLVCLPVHWRGLDFLIGRWGDWQGAYWVYEMHTTIQHKVTSVTDLKAWIKLCAEAHYNPHGTN